MLFCKAPTFVSLMQIGGLVLILFNGIALLQTFHWSFELLVHFRLQYCVLSAIGALFFYFTKHRLYLIANLALLVWNGLAVVPYLPSLFDDSRQEVPNKENSSLSIYFANVLTQNQEQEKLLNVLQLTLPDLIVLQEVNQTWLAQLSALEIHYPYRIQEPRDDNFGIVLYSKWPITQQHILNWGHYSLPSIDAEIGWNHQPFRLLSTHPLPPISAVYANSRNKQLAQAAEYAGRINQPRILVGDLNTSVWSHNFQQLIEVSNLKNTRKGNGLIPSWPIRLLPMMIPIDHILVSQEFRVLDLKGAAFIGSDHRPMIARLSFEP